MNAVRWKTKPEVVCGCATCGDGTTLPLDGTAAAAACSQCGAGVRVRFPDPGARTRCAMCGCDALYVQRDFNRRLGLAIVVVGAGLAPWTHYVSLGVATLADVALYRMLPRITVCYACEAIHRGVPVHTAHAAYDHHVEDRYKVEKSKRRVAIQAWRRSHPQGGGKMGGGAAVDAAPENTRLTDAGGSRSRAARARRTRE